MTNKYAMCITLATFCCISFPEKGHASDNEGDCGINFSKSAAPSQTLIKAIESQEPAKTHYDEQRDLYYLVDADGFEETKEETSRIEFSPALSPSKASLKAEQHHEELEFFYDPDRRKYYYISDNLVDDDPQPSVAGVTSDVTSKDDAKAVSTLSSDSGQVD